MKERDIRNYQGKKISRASGIARRQKILEATLVIIAREGMRGVRHRAVATEAEVPLAATTYYFKTLEELITDAFTHWAERNSSRSAAFRQQCFDLLAEYQDGQLEDPCVRSEVGDRLVYLVTDHIVRQAVEFFEDRVLELAFYHEAFLNPRLKALVLKEQEISLEELALFHRQARTENPDADARLSLSMIRWLERDQVMHALDLRQGPSMESIDRDAVFVVVRRHLDCLFGKAESRSV